jgi:hypothetical protein
MFVGTSLPVWSGESFGTVTALPSTLTVNVSTGGGAGLVSVVGAANILTQAILPTLRMPAEVKDRNDLNPVWQFPVKQPIREREHATASDRRLKERPPFRILANSLTSFLNGVEE